MWPVARCQHARLRLRRPIDPAAGGVRIQGIAAREPAAVRRGGHWRACDRSGVATGRGAQHRDSRRTHHRRHGSVARRTRRAIRARPRRCTMLHRSAFTCPRLRRVYRDGWGRHHDVAGSRGRDRASTAGTPPAGDGSRRTKVSRSATRRSGRSCWVTRLAPSVRARAVMPRSVRRQMPSSRQSSTVRRMGCVEVQSRLACCSRKPRCANSSAPGKPSDANCSRGT